MQILAHSLVENLQPQYAALLAVTSSPRHAVPAPGDTVLTIDLGTALTTESLINELFTGANLPGMDDVVIERFGSTLEFMASDSQTVKQVSNALFSLLNSPAPAGDPPQLADSVLLDSITPEYAVLLNRNRRGAMVAAGESVLMLDWRPASMVGWLANEIEKRHPSVKLVDCDARSGRLVFSGAGADLKDIKKEICEEYEKT